MVRLSAWWGSKSVDARTITSPFFQSPAFRTSMVLLPAAAVFASLVQEFFSVPCRFRVPPIIMIPRSLRSFVPPVPVISSSLTLSVRVIVALRVWGLASVPISSSPCTMIHSVVSSRSFLSAKLSLPLIVKLRSAGGETSRTTFISFSMVTTASLVGTFLSGQVAGSDQRFALAVEVFCCALRTAYPPRPKKAGTSNERNKRERFRIVKSRDRSCYATFSREDRRTCSKGQFYTYRRPDNILWFQRIRQRMGFAERRAEGIWARRFGARASN